MWGFSMFYYLEPEVSDKAKSALEKHQLQYADFENFVGWI
jgi:hypothetical protein